jgi:sugar phosphate isomerase/epimerase
VADINRVIRPLDPQWVGYDFDVAYATMEGRAAGFEGPLAIALPRLKMVTVRDFKWDQPAGGARTAKPCPLGEGVVDFGKFFAALAKAPMEDEPIGEEEERAAAESREWLKHNEPIPNEELLAEFGLTAGEFERMGRTPLPPEPHGADR